MSVRSDVYGTHVSDQVVVYWVFMIWAGVLAVAAVALHRKLMVVKYRSGEWNAFPDDV